MNQLAAELRTPPLPVLSFINCPELHKDIGTYFNATLRPPLFFVSLPEANEAVLARLFGTPKQQKVFHTPDGILKADWISKQRTRRAAVAVTFVNRSDVEGDPNAWMRMTRGLQAVKGASAHKGVWLVLVVVQDGPVTDLAQDRITGLWNSLEPKQLVVISRQLFDPALAPEQRRQLQEEQLKPLQQLVTEAAAAYYTAAGARLRQKQLDLSSTLGSCPPEINAATAFKAHPEAAPCHLLMSAAQLAVTRKNLVEQLVAISTGPPAFDASSVKKGRYLGQFERKQPEGPTNSCDLTDAEFGLFLEAEERRINHCQVVLDLLLQAQAAHVKEHQQQQQQGPPAAAAAAAPGKAVSTRGATDRLSARLAYLIAEQHVETHNLTAARKLLLQVVYTYRRDGWDALLLHSLLLLRDVCQRLKLHKESLLHSLEVASLATSLRGSAAGAAADSAAATGQTGMFDQEQAAGLASAALLGLLAGPQDNKSSLKKHPPVTQQQSGDGADQGEQHRQVAAQQQQQEQEGLGRVSVGSQSSPRSGSSSSWEYVVQQVDLAAALQQAPAARQEDGVSRASQVAEVLPLHKQQDYGWWRLVGVSGGFVAHGPDPGQLCLCVALRNNLPVPLPLQAANVTLSDAQGSWQQTLHVGPATTGSSSSDKHAAGQLGPSSPTAAAAAAITTGVSDLHLTEQQYQEQQQSWPLQLQSGAWQQLHAVFEPRCIGTVVCEQLQLQLSGQASVLFRVQSFPPGRAALGGSIASPEGPFGLQQQVKLGAWTAKVQHVGRLPQLQMLLPSRLLVGEFVPIDVAVSVTAAQPPATLELSVRLASGSPPPTLTLLAALPDGKLHELSLGAQDLPLPKLAAGSVWTQRLWARSREAGGCRLTATLSCPALVVQHADLSFRPPFEHRVRLSAEAGVHTLVGPSAAFAAVNGGSGGGTGQQGQGAQPAAGDRDAAVPLVVGQSVMAQVLVGTSHAADLLLLGAGLELEPGSQLKVLNNLSQQLAGAPVPAVSGSVHCLLLHLLPTAKAAGPVSMGRLKLSWRRKEPAKAGIGSSSSGGGSAGGSALAAALDGGATPAADVETSLELPVVVVQDSLLSAKASGPQNVTAGTAFPFTLQVHNLTTQPQEVQVTVQEAQGFVFAGSKQQVAVVVPRTIHTITWTLVAHASGQLQLPAVRVACSKLGCATVTQGAAIHVMPY